MRLPNLLPSVNRKLFPIAEFSKVLRDNHVDSSQITSRLRLDSGGFGGFNPTCTWIPCGTCRLDVPSAPWLVGQCPMMCSVPDGPGISCPNWTYCDCAAVGLPTPGLYSRN